MKKLLKYNERMFEHSEAFEVNAFKAISWEDTASEIQKLYKGKFDLDKFLKTQAIFKGLSQNKHQIDPYAHSLLFSGYKQPRVSPNTYTNFYNIFFSNDPSWKSFPKRNISLSCSTWDMKAMRYGGKFGVYCAIPSPGEKIGCCPGEDIWDGFGKSFDSIRVLDVLISKIVTLLKYTPNDTTDWSKMKKILADASQLTLQDMIDAVNDNDKISAIDGDVLSLLKLIYNNKMSEKVNFIERLQEILDPKANGFKTVKYPNRSPEFSEVWFEGNAVLIKNTDIEELAKYL